MIALFLKLVRRAPFPQSHPGRTPENVAEGATIAVAAFRVDALERDSAVQKQFLGFTKASGQYFLVD